MGYIPEDTVQEIFETVNIEDVVQDFVSLKRRGTNLTGLCPFHNEKTPSFSVSPSKNIFKCFGCGRGGNAVNFIMEHEQFTYPEALRYLAKKYNIEIEEEEVSEEYKEAQQQRDSLYIVTDYAQSFFKHQLLHDDYGRSVGLSYLKERGFSEATIEKFGLGFAPAGGKTFTDAALKKGFKLDFLQKAGVTSKSGYDFFRDRVQFPLHNLAGKVLGFAGRILTQKKKAPKYINTPESDIYNKRKFLYGFYFAKQQIRVLDQCLLVEGYTDVISMHQGGLENVVASSGTSLTEEQIQLIRRFTQNVTILYDGDAAGVKAAMRGTDMLLRADMNVRVLLLPQGEDPDSFTRTKGGEGFKAYIEAESQDFILFKMKVLLKDQPNDPIRRAKVLGEVVDTIAEIPNELKRSTYIRSCARELEVGEQILISELNKRLRKKYEKQQRRSKGQASPSDPYANIPPPVEGPPMGGNAAMLEQELRQGAKVAAKALFQERDLVRVLLQSGNKPFDEVQTVAEYIFSRILDISEEFIDTFEQPLYKEIVQIFATAVIEEQQLSLNDFLQHQNPDIVRLATDFSMQPYSYSPNWAKFNVFLHSQKPPDHNQVADAKSVVLRFLHHRIRKVARKNQAALKDFHNLETEQLARLLKVQQLLKKRESEITTELGTVTTIFGDEEDMQF